MSENQPNEENKVVFKPSDNVKKIDRKAWQLGHVPLRKVKKWSKIGIVWMLVWFSLFLFFMILLVFVFFYYLTNNPNAGKRIWLWPEAIKSFATVFAFLLFGTLFFVFLFLLILYIYRYTTSIVRFDKVKNAVLGLILLFLWTWNILAWVHIFQRIADIAEDLNPYGNNLLINYIDLKNWPTQLRSINAPLIAPLKVSFWFNYNKYMREIRPLINNWNIIEDSFTIKCGNWQELTFNWQDIMQTKQFAGQHCLFLNKWDYKVTISLKYYSKNSDETGDTKIWDNAINIKSQIDITTKTSLSDDKMYLIGGTIWSLLKFETKNIPNDLWLKDYKVQFDYNWDGGYDETIEWVWKYTYNDAELYNIFYKFPTIPLEYKFQIRIEPPNNPICSINYYKDENDEFTYYFSPNKTKTFSPHGNITKYTFVVKNLTEQNKLVTKSKDRIFKHRFDAWSDYSVTLEVIDSKTNQWSCTLDPIIYSDKQRYDFNVIAALKRDDWYEEVEYSGNNILLTRIPEVLKLDVKNIRPKGKNIKIWFDLDNDWAVDEYRWSTEIKIRDIKERKIQIFVEDLFWNKNSKTLTISINENPLIAKIEAKPLKWPIKLTVNFDASISTLNAEWDEIVIFDWDFGDGTTFDQTREWVVEHSYPVPWIYYTTVTVTSFKWHIDTTRVKVIAQKAIRQFKIIFDSHPSWFAFVNDKIEMWLIADWPISGIHWYFWDGQKLTCDGRECVQTSHIYTEPWTYKITTKVFFEDNSPPSTKIKKIKIEKD